jgi:hypothetical protein
VTSLNFTTICGNNVARARVTRARYTPRMRSAGRPITSPTTKVSTAAMTMEP